LDLERAQQKRNAKIAAAATSVAETVEPAWNGGTGFHSKIKEHHVYHILQGLPQKTCTILEQKEVTCYQFLAIVTKLLDDKKFEPFVCSTFIRQLHAALEQHGTSAQELPHDVVTEQHGTSEQQLPLDAATESDDDNDDDEFDDELQMTEEEKQKPCWDPDVKKWHDRVKKVFEEWQECYPFLDISLLSQSCAEKLKIESVEDFLCIHRDNVEGWATEFDQEDPKDRMEQWSNELEQWLDIEKRCHCSP